MTIEDKKVIELTYELRTEGEQGGIVEKVEDKKPLRFLYGAGNMLPKFEENLKGLKDGESFKFKIECDDAYGQASEEAVVDIPKNVFEVEGKVNEDILYEGNVIPMMDAQGNKYTGVVQEVKDSEVSMDFNHPLAGDDLYFTGKILAIRDASDKEVEQGHAEEE